VYSTRMKEVICLYMREANRYSLRVISLSTRVERKILMFILS
jgi:hypothetical protein